MLTKLTVRNFQSHKKSVLSFHQGVNTIVGSSRAGKSSLLRALRWVCQNKPTGTAFQSSWGGKTVVNVGTSDGAIVTRIKGKDNKYILRLDDVKEVLSAVGKGEPPDKIVKVLNLSSVNWQTQHQGIFMLADSPGQAARQLNSLTQLDLMTKVMGKIASDLRAVNNLAANTETNIANIREKLKPLKPVKDLIKQGESLDRQVKELKRMEKMKVSLDKWDNEVKALAKVGEASDRLDVLLKDTQLCDKLKKKYAAGKRLNADWEELRAAEVRLLISLNYNEIKLKKGMPKVCPLCEKET